MTCQRRRNQDVLIEAQSQQKFLYSHAFSLSMDVMATIRKIQSKDNFMRWKDVNEDACLTSAFSMYSEGEKREWLASYYNCKSEKMTTFSLNNEKGHEEAFKKEKDIPKLKLFEVKINDDKAVEAANKILHANYPGEKVQRTIMVLQKLETEPLWNVTFITATLKVVNIKLSAINAKKISHSMSNISDFMQRK